MSQSWLFIRRSRTVSRIRKVLECANPHGNGGRTKRANSCPRHENVPRSEGSQRSWRE